MFGFLKKLFGLGDVEQNTTDPIVKLGPEPTPEPVVGVIAQEVVKAMPEAVLVEQRPEVAVSAEAAWPFPTKMPEQGRRKKRTLVKREEESSKKKPASTKKAAPAPAKKKPAAKTPATKKKPAPPPSR